MEVKKILFVEDDQDMIDTVSDVLEEEGYSLIGVNNCESARGILEREKPDLVLLDLMLPGGNSFDFCRTASQGLGDFIPLPVFILSGKTSVECKIKSFMNGATKYFTKPFDVDELVEAIRGITERGALPESASL